MSDPIYTDRETARKALLVKIDNQERQMADANAFSTMAPGYLIADAEWRLRWIDCAPEGANHLVAPLQDKTGTPCGTTWNENVGPGLALREARERRGLNPLSGRLEPLPEIPPVARPLPFEVLLEGFDEQAHGAVDTRLPALQKMTDAELQAGVERFTEDGGC